MPELRNPFEEQKAAAEGRDARTPDTTPEWAIKAAEAEEKLRTEPRPWFGVFFGGVLWGTTTQLCSLIVVYAHKYHTEWFESGGRFDPTVLWVIVSNLISWVLLVAFVVTLIKRIVSEDYRREKGWASIFGFLVGFFGGVYAVYYFLDIDRQDVLRYLRFQLGGE